MSGEPARRIARELGRRGLAAPARLLLDAHLPLAPPLSDAGAAVEPLLRLAGGGILRDAARLLEDPTGLERLITEIDEVEERHAQPG
ncbi:MAG TPA: hypothetical protein VF364_04365 [Candidatus Limnocylindria bacterium]